MQIIKSYHTRNKFRKVVLSSLFKKRQEEAEAVINMAMGRLQVRVPSAGDGVPRPGSCDGCLVLATRSRTQHKESASFAIRCACRWASVALVTNPWVTRGPRRREP